MSTPSWRKNTSLVEQLIAAPHRYSFYQAVRLLERATLWKAQQSSLGARALRTKNAIATFVPPTTEVLRIKTNPTFKFPNTEILSITQNLDRQENTPDWTIYINFLGLAGTMGVLPYHYTELILQRLKQKDDALVHFFDLFNHRTASLFYQAATKYHLPIEYERKKLTTGFKKPRDKPTQALLSIIGLGTGGLNNRLQIDDESLLFYSGLFSQHIRTTSGLKQILQDYFNIPVKIQEFIGQWVELIPDIRTRVASRVEPKGQNARLGKSAMLGQKGWFSQGKIRITLGPLNREQFYKFAPGTKALRALNDMVRFYSGIEQDYDFVIEVMRKDIPQKIALNKNKMPIMGWTTWLSSADKPEADNQEILTITLSANRFK